MIGALRPACRTAALALLVCGAGCGGDPAPKEQPPPADAGVPDADAGGCGVGEAEVDGGCVGAGVPEGACGKGFTADGEGGCTPILPSAPCTGPTMAVPGDARCRPVAPCGAGAWGDIPIEPGTVFVDAAYAGGDGDGTQAKPWTTFAEALAAVSNGGMIAVAAGSYEEAPFLAGKPVRVWGVCPEKVEFVGLAGSAAFTVDASAELHAVAFRTDGTFGMLVGPGDILLDRIWVHDTGDYGMLVAGFFGPTKLELVGSLIEQTSGAGIAVVGATATIDGVVVREQREVPTIGPGRGVSLEDDADVGRASVTILGSVIEHNSESGIVVFGSDATIDGTVVQDTEAEAAGTHGVGIAVQRHLGPSKVELTRSVVRRNRLIGVSVIGSELTMDATVIADTLPQASNGLFGDGMALLRLGGVGSAVVDRSLIARGSRTGVANFGGSVTLERSSFTCNAIDLDGENTGGDYVFQDLGGNACGCDEAELCQVLSTNLAAPEAIP